MTNHSAVVELAMRRVSFRLKKTSMNRILASALEEIADEIARISSGTDEQPEPDNKKSEEKS